MQSKITSKIKGFFQKASKIIFGKPAWFFVILFCLDLIIGFSLAWNYMLHPPSASKKTSQAIPILNTASLDQFIKDYSEREKAFQAAQNQQYKDIFKGFPPAAPIATSSQSH